MVRCVLRLCTVSVCSSARHPRCCGQTWGRRTTQYIALKTLEKYEETRTKVVIFDLKVPTATEDNHFYFYLIFGPFLARGFSTHATSVVCHTSLGAHACGMLIGACNPML